VDTDGLLAVSLILSGFLSGLLLAMDSGDTYYLKRLSNTVRMSPKAAMWDALIARSRSVLGAAAAILLCAALAVSACTWFGAGIVPHQGLLTTVGLGTAVLFFLFVGLERFQWRMRSAKTYTLGLPRWSLGVLGALFFYVAATFTADGIRSVQRSSDSPPGSVQLEISTQEKLQQQRRTLRGLSDVWVLLSAVAAARLLLGRNPEYDGPFGKYSSVVHEI
jgi:hypothetical protein